MRHADDGTLHALLDGALRAESPEQAAEVRAHLEACADCRARLEAAAEVRDRASAILGGAEPPASPGDFEEVLARAAATLPADAAGAGVVRRRLRRTRRLAWAASLILALGTGYLIGDRFGVDLEPGGGQLVEGSTAPPPEPEGASPSAPSLREPEAGEPARGDELTDRNRSAPAPAPAPPAEAAGERSRQERPAGEGAVSPAAAPSADAAKSAGRPAEGEVPERVEAEATSRTQESGAARSGRQPAEEAVRPAPAAALADAGEATPFLSDAGWEAVELARARELMEGQLLALPEAEIRGARARVEGEMTVVETVQALPGEVLVQVRQYRGGEEVAVTGAAAPQARRTTAPAPESAGYTTITVPVGIHRLEVRGSLPADALRELALRAAPVDG